MAVVAVSVFVGVFCFLVAGVIGLIAFGIASLFRRLRSYRGILASSAVASVLAATWAPRFFPSMPGYVPGVRSLKLVSLNDVDDFPVWGSFYVYRGEYERTAPAAASALDIERTLRADPALVNVTVDYVTEGKWEYWTISADLPRVPRLPAGGRVVYHVSTENEQVRFEINRSRPWM